ncbi:MAG TPA: DUF222 domain-containing protein [Acidimicrobiia bacterium]|jgi:hypothetical protein
MFDLEWDRIDNLDRASLDELGELLVRLEAVMGRLEVERARVLAEFDRRRGPESQEMRSATAWLKHHCRMSAARAHRTVALSHRLETLTHTAKAIETGGLSLDQARVVCDLPEYLDPELEAAEVTLVNTIGPLSVADSKRIVDYWRSAVDGPGLLDDLDAQAEHRYLHASRTTAGMVKLDGLLEPLAGEKLLTALAAATPPRTDDDLRSPGQRRADALSDLARSYLDSGAGIGGEKPHLLVHVDLTALHGHGGGLHETADGTVLHPADIQTLACDCQITRIVFGAEGQPVDVGRASRTIPPWIRRAVIARDRHCVHPGCDMPARHCDVHHKIPWSQGGVTSVESSELRCRHHHIHEHRRLARTGHPQRK